MITAFKPPVKPLSETWIGDADLQKLEESQKRADLFALRKSEVDRRLQQTTEWRNKVHQALQTKDVGPRERRTMEIDMETATRELDNLAHDLDFILEQIEVEKRVQGQAQARLDIIKAERSESVWMVSSLGIPMQWRIGEKKEEPVANEQSASSIPKYFDDDDAETEEEEELEELSQDSLVATEPVVHLLAPDSVCEGADGTVYVTDTLHSCIRKIVPAGTVHHFAGRETTHADLIPPPPPPKPTRPATRIRSRRAAEGEEGEGEEEEEEKEEEGGGEEGTKSEEVNEEKREGKETEDGGEKEKTETGEEKEEEKGETGKGEEEKTEEANEETAKMDEGEEEKEGTEEEKKQAEKAEEGKTEEETKTTEEEKDHREKSAEEKEKEEKEEKEEGETEEKEKGGKSEEEPEGKPEEDEESAKETKNEEEKGEAEKAAGEEEGKEGEEAKTGQEKEETGVEKAEEEKNKEENEETTGEEKTEDTTEEGDEIEEKAEEETTEEKAEGEPTEETAPSDEGEGEEEEKGEEEEVVPRPPSSVPLQIVELSRPRGIVIEEGGNFFVCDTGNHCIRGISADGTRSTTLAGVPRVAGFEDGLAREAKFNCPWAACLGEVRDGHAALFVCDAANHCVRAVHFASDDAEAPARVCTVLGTPQEAGAGARHLNFPWSCCWTAQGLAVGDKYNRRLLLCSLDPDVPLRVLSETWPAELRFGPRGIVVDTQGSLLLSDSWSSRLWRVPLSGSPLEKVAGSGLRDHRDGRAEFAEFRYPGGMCLDRNGALLVVDVGNHCVRKLRELREQEVKAKLRKMMADMNNRGVRNAFFTWTMAPSQAPEPPQPVEIVVALAMGTHEQLGERSPLASFPPDALRSMVVSVAKALQWRVVRTREEAQTTFVADEEELVVRMAEARKVFTEFDADGGGSIDAKELREALEASGMVVSDEELTALIDEYDADKSGEISFDEFCAMQGIALAPPEPPPEEAPAKPKAKAPAKKPAAPGPAARPAVKPPLSKDGKPPASRVASREGRSSPSPPPRSGSPLNASAAPRAKAAAPPARTPKPAASPLPKPRASGSKSPAPASAPRASAPAPRASASAPRASGPATSPLAASREPSRAGSPVASPLPRARAPAGAGLPKPASRARDPPSAGAAVPAPGGAGGAGAGGAGAGAGAGAGGRERVPTRAPASPAPKRASNDARPQARRPSKA